jgi:signal transduction histidine kinase
MNHHQAEVARLEAELEMRDQLVQQLSQELFRLVKGNAGFLQTVNSSSITRLKLIPCGISAWVEKQIDFYQGQLQEKDSEVFQLRQTVEELTDRSRMLEQVVAGITRGLSPEVCRAAYRR